MVHALSLRRSRAAASASYSLSSSDITISESKPAPLLHALAQPPFLDEAFAAVEGERARVGAP